MAVERLTAAKQASKVRVGLCQDYLAVLPMADDGIGQCHCGGDLCDCPFCACDIARYTGTNAQGEPC